jgi:hypothetical protein
MTIAFTSVMAIFIIERVDERAGAKSLAPLVITGALSIMYWRQVFPMFSNILPFREYFFFCFQPPLFSLFILNADTLMIFGRMQWFSLFHALLYL